MKRIKSIMAGSILAVLIAEGALTAQLRAQFAPGEVFTVPFAFTAEGHEIAPGTYEVRRDSSYLISIQNVKTGEKQLFSARPEGNAAISVKGLLVFQRCGDRAELSEFHIQGTTFYSVTIEGHGKRSSEVERCSAPDTTRVAAR